MMKLPLLRLLLVLLCVPLCQCVVVERDSNAATGAQLSGGASQEERPASGAVPDKVIDDCLATLKRQIPDRSMKVIRAKRGEASFIIDVSVEGVPNLWRCYHDGTSCTGTEYQGEG